jgi:hypothetical protein
MQYYKEIILLEAILLAGCWMWNEYIAFMVSIIFIPLFISIIVISKIADYLEPSRIGPLFYRLLVGLTIVPIILLLVFWSIYGGEFDWMKT